VLKKVDGEGEKMPLCGLIFFFFPWRGGFGLLLTRQNKGRGSLFLSSFKKIMKDLDHWFLFF